MAGKTDGSRFTIEATRPDVYLDKARRPINGYSIDVLLYDYQEQHTVKVPSLDPVIVKAAIEKLLADRDALSNLG
jgi:hypothetical protein